MYKYTQREWRDVYLAHRQKIIDGDLEEPLVIEDGDFTEVDMAGCSLNGIAFRGCRFKEEEDV